LVGLLVAVHAAGVLSIAAQPLEVPPARQGLARIAPFFRDMLHRPEPGADFFAVYHAGVNAERGESPYGMQENPPRTPYYYHYRYLPGFAGTFGVAVANLSPRLAYIGWVLITEAALVAVAFLLWRRARRLSDRHRWAPPFVIAILASSTPYLLELHMGQFTAFALCLALIAVLLADAAPDGRARQGGADRLPLWGAAVAYACAVEIKVFPLVLAPALLRRRAGRWALVGALVLLAVAEGPLLARKPDLYHAFSVLNFDSGLVGMNDGNFGLTYALYRVGIGLGHAWSARSFWILSTSLRAVFLGAATVAALGRRSHGVAAAATLVFAHFLSYPEIWEHHLSGVLIFGVAFLLVRLGDDRLSRAEIGLMLGALVMLALPTTYYWQDPWHDPAHDPSTQWGTLAHLLPPLCKILPTLILFTLGLRAAWRKNHCAKDCKEAT
jgi:hypothetical protein